MAPSNLVSRLLGLPLFPNFPRLPKELRDAIWEQAISEPRIVPLRRRRLRQGSDGETQDASAVGDRNNGLWGFKCDLPPPSILFVNHESHDVASRYYSKAFSCVRSNHTSVPEAHINFEKDTLYLDGDWTLQIYYRASEVDQADREKVNHLAILYIKTDDDSFAEELAGRECREENEAWLAQYLAYFPNVKTVTVVLEHAECPKYEDGFTSKDMSTLAFTDEPNQPMDVHAALEIFENKNDTAERAVIPNHPRSFGLDWELLEQRRLECVRWDYVPPEHWKMPEIKQCVMVSAGFKALLDKQMADYLL